LGLVHQASLAGSPHCAPVCGAVEAGGVRRISPRTSVRRLLSASTLIHFGSADGHDHWSVEIGAQNVTIALLLEPSTVHKLRELAAGGAAA